ncbi:MAG: hypothetical protein Q8N05_18735 [Bacteroidota bacterium]|nr:hypothetical protein [Bacteroidota bacterium]
MKLTISIIYGLVRTDRQGIKAILGELRMPAILSMLTFPSIGDLFSANKTQADERIERSTAIHLFTSCFTLNKIKDDEGTEMTRWN